MMIVNIYGLELARGLNRLDKKTKILKRFYIDSLKPIQRILTELIIICWSWINFPGFLWFGDKRQRVDQI